MEVFNTTGSLCDATSHKYPLNVAHATGSLVNKHIVICGGRDASNDYADCYKFDQNLRWGKLGKMSTPRVGSASISVETGLLIAGGSNGSHLLNSIETVHLNGSTMTADVSLPEERRYHCLVKYKTLIFSIGGWDNKKEETVTVWIFDNRVGMKYFGEGPKLNFARGGHGCGVYYSEAHDDRPLLVVAGSYCCGKASYTSEYWDFTWLGSTWTQTCTPFVTLSFLHGQL